MYRYMRARVAPPEWVFARAVCTDWCCLPARLHVCTSARLHVLCVDGTDTRVLALVKCYTPVRAHGGLLSL